MLERVGGAYGRGVEEGGDIDQVVEESDKVSWPVPKCVLASAQIYSHADTIYMT